jgi:hypothetical protein
MSDLSIDVFGERVGRLAVQLPYPATPNVLAGVRQRGYRGSAPRAYRRLAAVVIALVLVAASALAVPQVRAAIVEFFQIGVVRIFPVAPTITPTAIGTQTLPAPTPTLLPSLFNLEGETTLAQARADTGLTLPLPTYPADLGRPNAVFVQEVDGTMVVMVWIDKENPTQIGLSLHIIEQGSYAITKIGPTILSRTAVNDEIAYWTEGPYIVRLRNGDMDQRRLIAGHVLIWSEGILTYRLETDLSMEEAVKIAESLQPIE